MNNSKYIFLYCSRSVPLPTHAAPGQCFNSNIRVSVVHYLPIVTMTWSERTPQTPSRLQGLKTSKGYLLAYQAMLMPKPMEAFLLSSRKPSLALNIFVSTKLQSQFPSESILYLSFLVTLQLKFKFPTAALPRMCPDSCPASTPDTDTSLEDHRQTGTETHAGSPHSYHIGNPRINKPCKLHRVHTETMIVRWGPASRQATGMTIAGNSD